VFRLASSRSAWALDATDASACRGRLSGVGPRVEESGFGLITGLSFSLPYEDLRLKPR